MVRITQTNLLFALVSVGLFCFLTPAAQAQQQGGNVGTGNNIGTTTNTGTGSSQTTTQQGTASASDFALERPDIATDINELTEGFQSSFVGTSDLNNQFLGVQGSGENTNAQSNRQFTTRTPGQNVNQGTQRQPLYRTFGTNNVPYRAPHKIAFEVSRPPGRSVDLNLRQKVQTLNSRRPQFRNVEFVVSENTVTLRGSVENERDLKLAMLFVKMEPGVNQVVNELEVTSLNPVSPDSAAAQ